MKTLYDKKQYWYLEKCNSDGTGAYFKVGPVACDKCRTDILGCGWFRAEWSIKKEPSLKHYHPECIKRVNDSNADISEEYPIILVNSPAFIPSKAVMKFPHPPITKAATDSTGNVITTIRAGIEAVERDEGRYVSKAGQCLNYLEQQGIISPAIPEEVDYQKAQEQLRMRELELEQRPHETISKTVDKNSDKFAVRLAKKGAEEEFDSELHKQQREKFFEEVMAEKVLTATPVKDNHKLFITQQSPQTSEKKYPWDYDGKPSMIGSEKKEQLGRGPDDSSYSKE